MERRPIRYAAGSLAGSAFIAVTQILTRDSLDISLWIALAIFAVTIPFQIVLFFARVPPVLEVGLTLSQTVYWHVQSWSTRLILLGFIALFWHFAWWLGIAFTIAAYGAFRAYKFWATSTDFDQQHLG
jgi:hypothetical protein